MAASRHLDTPVGHPPDPHRPADPRRRLPRCSHPVRRGRISQQRRTTLRRRRQPHAPDRGPAARPSDRHRVPLLHRQRRTAGRRPGHRPRARRHRPGRREAGCSTSIERSPEADRLLHNVLAHGATGRQIRTIGTSPLPGRANADHARNRRSVPAGRALVLTPGNQPWLRAKRTLPPQRVPWHRRPKRDRDELAAGAERPDDVSTEAAALRKTRLEQRSKEVLMVRTAVRAIELSTCDVQVFKARHVIGRVGL